MAIEIKSTLEEVKTKLDELRTSHKYKKANRETETKAILLKETALCNGKLENCKSSLLSVVQQQCINVIEGEQQHMTVEPQKEIIQDAVTGYLLIREAIFYLKTVGDYENITRAYYALDAASKTVSHKKTLLGTMRSLSFMGGKSYAKINKKDAVGEKRAIAENILPDIISNGGDIETALAGYYSRKGRKPPVKRETMTDGRFIDTVPSGDELDDEVSKVLDEEPDMATDLLDEQCSIDVPDLQSHGMDLKTQDTDDDMDMYLEQAAREEQDNAE